jgi:prevent-host-death family protein
MREIGVRDLKAHLSELLREVDAGEELRVTVRGRPVADILPANAPRGDQRLRALVAEGKVTPPMRTRPSRAPRLAAAAGSASAAVLADRDHER